MKRIVIARFKESLEWTNKIDPAWTLSIVDKSNGYITNYYGREAHSYLHWVTRNSENISPLDTIVFCQGSPFGHDEEFIEKLDSKSVFGMPWECDGMGRPDCNYALCNEYCLLFGMPVQRSYRFVSGAQFKVTGEQILNRSLDWWTALLGLTKIDPNSAYTLERLWPVIFGFEV